MLFQNLPINERIFRGSKYNFLALSRAELKDFAPSESCIVISVTDPKSMDAEIFDSPYLHGVLRLQFHDVDKAAKFKFEFENAVDVYFEPENAKEILAFVKNHLPKVKLIICQCEQGVSRSPAIAGALSKILQNEDDFFLKNYWANQWVYNLILEQSLKTE